MSANSFLIGTVIANRGRHITNWGSVFNTNWATLIITNGADFTMTNRDRAITNWKIGASVGVTIVNWCTKVCNLFAPPY